MTTTPTRWIVACVLLAACSDEAPPLGEGDSSSGSGSSSSPGTPDGTGVATTAGSGNADGPGTTDDPGTTADPGDTADTEDTTTGEPPWEGEPLPEGRPGQWQWVDIEGTECIDGSPTGLGVRYGEGDGLVIYFEGGGGCFDFATCSLFYSSFANFDQNAFELLVPSLLSSGIFADEPGNPVRDWSFVYIPYCTGDVHAGDQDQGQVDDFFGDHQFVGYRNAGLDLERIGATFPEPDHVLITGISAGGYGAAYNYDRIATAYEYANIPVTLLDDSGPPMSEQYAPTCLQEQWRQMWNLDNTLPAECGDCFDPGGWAIDLAQHIRQRHSDQRFGLLSYLRDGTIRTFLAGGLNNCIGGIYPGADYEAGLVELRDDIFPDDPGFGTYYVSGIGHTFLPFGAYQDLEVSGVFLVDWVSDLLEGNATHVSP
ncbi:MAG: pectin acetylesterase-family hydrolase [Myxococcota bacterium]